MNIPKFNDNDKTIFVNTHKDKVYSWGNLFSFKRSDGKPLQAEQLNRTIERFKKLRLLEKMPDGTYKRLDKSTFNNYTTKYTDEFYLESIPPEKLIFAKGFKIYGGFNLDKKIDLKLNMAKKIFNEILLEYKSKRLSKIQGIYKKKLKKIEKQEIKKGLNKNKLFYCTLINNVSLWDEENFKKNIKSTLSLKEAKNPEKIKVQKKIGKLMEDLFSRYESLKNPEIFKFLQSIIQEMKEYHSNLYPDFMIIYGNPNTLEEPLNFFKSPSSS